MDRSVNQGRRRFLTGNLHRPPAAIRPPWLSAEGVDACTGCGACADACPERLVGIDLGKPTVSFEAGECTFCRACADACPDGLFDEDGPAFAHHAVIGGDCLPHRGVVCQSCRDVCPEDAVRFVPRLGGPFLPMIRTSACTGCGACVAPCPTSAIRMEQVMETVDA
jgi:ferredoxin-type protein NapF